MNKFIIAFLYIVIASAFDYGLYYFLSEHSPFFLAVVIIVVLSVGELFGLVKLLF